MDEYSIRKIRIAQIGMSRYSHAPEIFATLKLHPEIFDLVGYALVEDERETCAEKLKYFEGYPELTLEDILNSPTIEAVAAHRLYVPIRLYEITCNKKE